MTDIICLDKKYSTTKLLLKKKTDPLNIKNGKFESFLFLPTSKDRVAEGGLGCEGYFKKSYVDKPLISIVTVVFNSEDYLEEAIKSVINQSYDNL